MAEISVTEIWAWISLVVTVVGALLHCYLMESENKREFGEVSEDETKALYAELRHIRREKTISDIRQLMLNSGLICKYIYLTEEFEISHAAVGSDRRVKKLGRYQFRSYQDALDWLQTDYLDIDTTKIQG